MAKIFTTFTVVDQASRTTTMRRELVTTSEVQAIIDTATAVAAFNAMMKSQISKTVIQIEDAYATVVPAGANIDSGATFTAQLAGRPEKAATKVPDPLDSLILPGGNINLLDALVIAVENMYKTTGGIMKISDGETIDGFVAGVWDT